MIIVINDEPLFVTRKQGKEILRDSKDSVGRGIYAVKRYGCIELKNESHNTKESLEKAIKAYRKQRFKVYFSEGDDNDNKSDSK